MSGCGVGVQSHGRVSCLHLDHLEVLSLFMVAVSEGFSTGNGGM